MTYSPTHRQTDAHPRVPIPTEDEDRFMRALADDTDDPEESPWMSMGTLQYWSASDLAYALSIYGRTMGRPWFVASMLPIVYPWPLPAALRAFTPGPMPAPRRGSTKQLSPDVMVAVGVTDTDRTSYDLEEERSFPPFVLEVVSPTSVERDREDKVWAYDLLRAREYAVFTPRDGEASLLEGWRRGESGRFETWPLDAEGRLWSDVLGMFLKVEGQRVTAETAAGERLLTPPEEARARHEAEVARQQSEEARQRAERVGRRAEEARGQEAARRREAEEEVARLRREIDELRGQG